MTSAHPASPAHPVEHSASRLRVPRTSVGPRAYFLGSLLVVASVVWTIQIDLVWWTSRNWFSLNYHVVFMLLVLAALNGLAGRVPGVRRLSRSELLLIAIMLTVATPVAGHMFLQRLVPIITHAFRYGTPENQWARLLQPLLPRWLVASDPVMLRAIYAGNADLYQAGVWKPLVVPVVVWTGFTLALLGTMVSFNRLLRRQWMERERLSYPVIELPFQLTDPQGAFWRQPLLWLAFGLAGSLDMVNGLSYLWPSIPEFPLLYDLRPFLTEKPWRNIGYVALSCRPHVIGLGYLIPADLSFSMWLFFLLAKGQLLVAGLQGWDAIPEFPYLHYQSMGAYLAIFGFAVAMSGPQLLRVMRRRWPGDTEGAEERRAAVGVVGGLMCLIGFSLAAGMAWWAALPFFALYFAVAIAITRIRAEAGAPVHDLLVQGPGWALASVFGPGSFPQATLTMFAMYHWFNRDTSCHPMPYQLEAYKLGDRGGLSSSLVTRAMVLALLIGTVTAVWSILHTVAQLGGATAKIHGQFVWYGAQPYEQVGRWLAAPRPANTPAGVALLAGAALTWGMQWARTRFLGWPFHPVGFALQAGWLMPNIWSEILIAWLLKVLVLRYGGLRGYRKLMPFFLGLMLGEYTVQGFWALAGVVLGMPTYPYWG
jgi:hypothetical protein